LLESRADSAKNALSLSFSCRVYPSRASYFYKNLVIDKKVGKVCANGERSHDENRLAALESQISELKSLLLSNVSDSLQENKLITLL
jgi:hypothetical protein